MSREIESGIRTSASPGRLYHAGDSWLYGGLLLLREGSGRVVANMVITTDVTKQVAFLDTIKVYSALAFIVLSGVLISIVHFHLKRAEKALDKATQSLQEEAKWRDEIQARHIEELELKNQEIIQFNQIMTQQIDELTRFQKATISRELRMKALHDENLILRQRIKDLDVGGNACSESGSAA